MVANSSDGEISMGSRSTIQSLNGPHEFTVKGFSVAKGMGAGKYIKSDIFTVGGYDWVIAFYPDGKNSKGESIYVSAFIVLTSTDTGADVRALFELTLLDQSGKGKHKVHRHNEPYTLKCPGSMWYGKACLVLRCLMKKVYNNEVWSSIVKGPKFLVCADLN